MHVLDGTRFSDFDCPPAVEPGSTCVVSRLDDSRQLGFYAFEPEYGLGRLLFSVDTPPAFANWAMSPDRSRIALAHNLGMIRIIDVATADEKVLSNPEVRFGEFFDWAGDGQGIVIDSWVGNGSRMKSLVYVSLANGEATVLRDEPNQWHLVPVISPDGGKIAFGVMKFSGNAWMIGNP